MKASAVFGPDLGRILHDQARMGRLIAQAERQAVAAFGGKASTARRRRNDRGQQRAMSSFGVDGKALCGCGEARCETCSSASAAGGGEARRCPCGKVGCKAGPPARGSTGPAGMGAGGGVSARRAYAPAPPVNPTWANPNPGAPLIIWPDVPSFDIPDIVVPDDSSDSSEEASTFEGEYFDIHSHNFCAEYDDWYAAEAGTAGTSTDARIDWLYSLKDEGIGRMAISGMADGTAGSDPVLDFETINDITYYAYGRYPDFFVPFIQIFPENIDGDAPDYVDDLLADGFQGVGELFIHGHGTNVNALEPLRSVCVVAASYGVPVLMHWEFGNVDDTTVRTADENFDQLVELLDEFPNVPVFAYTAYAEHEILPLKVVIAHCGAGPGDMASGSSTFTAYQDRIETLLATYHNVYFDLAGMQTKTVRQLYTTVAGTPRPTDLGDFLLQKMAEYPNRFLVGIDTENRSESMTDDYGDTVSYYGNFLAMTPTTGTPLSDGAQSAIKAGNAFLVLYSKATTWTPPTTSSSSTSWSTVHWP